MKFLLALIILISFTGFRAFAQTGEVEDMNELREFLKMDGQLTGTVFSDSSLVLNQVYIPAFKSSYQNVFTGNIGSAGFSLVRELSKGAFLNWGMNHYDDYKLGKANRKIFLNQKPYSRVNYLIGSKKEQILNVTHQQHITKNIIAGIDFLTQASNGFYSNQLTKQRSFDAFYLMHSTSNRFNLLASYTSNKHESQENGGIVNDTVFINQTDSRDAEESLVNLLGAKSLNKDNAYFLKQKLYVLGNGIKPNYTDSLEISGLSIALTNTTNYTRRVFIFEESDVDPDFFNSIYYDSVSTYDSSFVSEMVNRFGIEFQKTLSARTDFGFEIFTNYQDFSFFQNNIDTAISSVDLGIDARLKKSDAFEFLVESKVSLSDKLKDSYYFAGILIYDVSQKIKIESKFSLAEQPGSIIFKLFDSNHFKWANSFENEKCLTFDASISFKDLVKFRYNVKNYNNYLFFNSIALAQQFGNDISVNKMELLHALNYKKIHYNGSTSYNRSSKEEILPVPEMQLYHSFYFEDRIFKVGMPIQIGFDFRYHTKYFAQAYMPATGQRYLQAKQKIGDYLFADFFFNFRINNSKIFFKMDHLNEGFAKRNYFIMPFHPMPGRSYKVGIKWKFFD